MTNSLKKRDGIAASVLDRAGHRYLKRTLIRDELSSRLSKIRVDDLAQMNFLACNRGTEPEVDNLVALLK